MKTPIFLVVALLCAGAAQAQSVWRCGPDGRSFSDTPCPQGRALETVAARPQADVQMAQQVAQREKALAQRLVSERQQREAQSMAAAAGIHGTRLVKASSEKRLSAQPHRKKHRLEAGDSGPEAEPSSRRTKG